ncbi:GMC oxidoreductase [Lepidopterella palustris CBS 459.81]|uniref:GMC oxidoreductase n=1 Tax=Lepidopterella palustris CBS 459.81 TaxID=1314670 RepID=A0A8E2EBG2_9PEZI|nr:GMC oxidoreductase [Lepidopterella palustris CBS 459.81]
MNLFFSLLPFVLYANAYPLLGSSFGVPLAATYDYVVIGGGTAGLTVAARLAENPALTIAVIEAGSFYEIDNGNLSQIPAYDFYSVGATYNPLIDWGYHTIPQAGVLNAVVHYPRGKTLGGSSGRNYMAYSRGSKKSYDMWADLVGDDSYKWTNFLPYFEKSMDFTPPDMSKRAANATPQYDLSVLGNGNGPLDVTFPNYGQPWSSWVQIALKGIGVNPIAGFLSGVLFGSSYTTNTIQPKTQTRESSQTGFLNPALVRGNVIVYQKTLAKKIVFDGNKVATGVLVDTGGAQYTLSAKREVILSSGAFGSPQLLMVSGIGPAATLQNLGIPVISNLAGVGQNMWDHLFFGPSYRVKVLTSSSYANPEFAANATFNYQNTQTGPLTNTGGDFFGWEKLPPSSRSTLSPTVQSSLTYFPDDWPELEFLSIPTYLGPTSPPDLAQYGSIAAGLVAPLSRGSVSINSSDTSDPPLINPNWLTHPTDIAVAIAGFKRARAAISSPGMSPVLVGDEAYPGAGVQSDSDILEVIQTSFQSLSHAAATCKMGKAGDGMAVVDSRGRVFGVGGLRVVDVSAFAILPPGNPQSTVYALAEKIADDIKKS